MPVFALKYSREIMQPQEQQMRGLEKTKKMTNLIKCWDEG